MLTTCREEDVSQTLYKDTLKLSKPEADAAAAAGVSTSVTSALPQKSKESKVNRICDAFVAALKNKMSTNLQNLITAHVCKKPPDLEAGLRLVADLRGSSYVSLSNLTTLTMSTVQEPEKAEEAVEHMCFLTDANLLYNEALGLYDLELTLLVAQQAQRVGDSRSPVTHSCH